MHLAVVQYTNPCYFAAGYPVNFTSNHLHVLLAACLGNEAFDDAKHDVTRVFCLLSAALISIQQSTSTQEQSDAINVSLQVLFLKTEPIMSKLFIHGQSLHVRPAQERPHSVVDDKAFCGMQPSFLAMPHWVPWRHAAVSDGVDALHSRKQECASQKFTAHQVGHKCEDRLQAAVAPERFPARSCAMLYQLFDIMLELHSQFKLSVQTDCAAQMRW